MQMIRKKIRSQRGASITYALLLFLVCAVIGSIVLTAGMVAAGRMSQVAEMDQRYYSVNSAARLLIDLIDDDEVVIIKTQQKNADGTNNGVPIYTDNKGETLPPATAIGGFDSIAKEAAYYMASSDDARASYKFDLTMGSEEDSIDSLKVSVEELLSKTGVMTLRVKNVSEKAKDSYQVNLTFNMDLAEDTDSTPAQDVTTAKYTWHIRDIQILGSERWEVKTP